MKRLIYILSVIVSWFEDRQEKKRQDEAQAKHDELEKNYLDFYDNHFGGVPYDDATKTDKANARKD